MDQPLKLDSSQRKGKPWYKWKSAQDIGSEGFSFLFFGGLFLTLQNHSL